MVSAPNRAAATAALAAMPPSVKLKASACSRSPAGAGRELDDHVPVGVPAKENHGVPWLQPCGAGHAATFAASARPHQRPLSLTEEATIAPLHSSSRPETFSRVIPEPMMTGRIVFSRMPRTSSGLAALPGPRAGGDQDVCRKELGVLGLLGQGPVGDDRVGPVLDVDVGKDPDVAGLDPGA